MLLIGCASAFAWRITFLHIPTLIVLFLAAYVPSITTALPNWLMP